jgi:hypothetical protein
MAGDGNGSLIDVSLLITGSNGTLLFQSIEAPFGNISLRVQMTIEGLRGTGSLASALALIAPFRYRVWDASPSKKIPATRVAIPPVGKEPIRAFLS